MTNTSKTREALGSGKVTTLITPNHLRHSNNYNPNNRSHPTTLVTYQAGEALGSGKETVFAVSSAGGTWIFSLLSICAFTCVFSAVVAFKT